MLLFLLPLGALLTALRLLLIAGVIVFVLVAIGLWGAWIYIYGVDNFLTWLNATVRAL